MARISISQVLQIRSRLRIFTVMATLIVGAFLFQMLIAQNPGSARAACSGNDCSTSESGYFTATEFYAGTYGSGTWRFSVNPNTKLTISGSSTVIEIYSSLYVAELTVKDGATVTHAAIATTDVDTDKQTLLPSGQLKKVLISAATIRLETLGRIDVSGKGYPGGPQPGGGGCTTCQGYGPGGGNSAYTYDEDNRGGSGAGHGGIGGHGYDNNGDIDGGGTYDVSSNPTNLGSGGGYGRYDHGERNGAGGAGGGVVILNATNIYIDGGSSITASGANGGNSDASGGGGSGGSINITATTIYGRINTGFNYSVAGDNTNIASIPPSEKGEDGSVIFTNGNTTNFGTVTAKGGTGPGNAGSGGGGRILINAGTFSALCRISYGDNDYIPAACENQDVTIDGFGAPADSPLTIYADTIPVWQSSGTYTSVCSMASIVEGGHTYVYNGTFNGQCLYSYWDPDRHDIFRDYTHNWPYSAGETCQGSVVNGYDIIAGSYGSGATNCDTKRHFASLTIKNGAILTHQAVTVDETVAGGATIADDTTGTGRWKKIDIVTTGDVLLETSAKIDVSGKGYPGGHVDDCENLPSPQTPLNGWGPGRGLWAGFGGDWGFGAGGAYYGNGGDADNDNDDSSFISGTGGIGYYSAGLFDFGSGGAAGCGDWRETQGGAGGGRVRLTGTSGSTIYFDGGYIYANGESGTYDDGTGNESSGGSGSGGHIELYAGEIQLPENFQTSSVRGSLGSGRTSATNGRTLFDNSIVEIDSNNHTYDTFSDKIVITANGGWAWKRGAGGGGMILAKPMGNNLSIAKTLTAYNRPYTASPLNPNFNPYALKVGDEILVTLNISNLVVNQQVTVTDNVLALPDSTVQCRPIPGTDSPTSTTLENTKVVWTIIPTANSTELSYHCIVFAP